MSLVRPGRERGISSSFVCQFSSSGTSFCRELSACSQVISSIDGKSSSGVSCAAQQATPANTHAVTNNQALLITIPLLFDGIVATGISVSALSASVVSGRPLAVLLHQDIGLALGLDLVLAIVFPHQDVAGPAPVGGYQTVISEGGVNLSMGQRQLICIARAALADPRILILDEATASVDTVTEAAIQDAVGRLLSGRTAVVIAHRLGTIRNADVICVVHNGRIVERGGHDTLLKRGGVYRELYDKQFI